MRRPAASTFGPTNLSLLAANFNFPILRVVVLYIYYVTVSHRHKEQDVLTEEGLID
ncbi:hypothetical protein P691DRAFT_413791 [Macrolepiota fuliginosa MF-IS2]|uniref:Uncharacterized protein n=1 Tax=Macrolepiota fuliginosa MF-IS2 TaxID=1400762 RepID=A0A9P5X246_9AGAR|nr:hypothetical protein P691DRAFT_413791 [Macrolepiota fuliginosa MF-IS2]